MERLWSPWRLAYVTSTSSKHDGCIFCDVSAAGPGGAGDPERDRLVLAHGRDCYVILNLYPYTNGHLMVVPRRHIASLATATADELTELMLLTRDAEVVDRARLAGEVQLVGGPQQRVGVRIPVDVFLELATRVIARARELAID